MRETEDGKKFLMSLVLCVQYKMREILSQESFWFYTLSEISAVALSNQFFHKMNWFELKLIDFYVVEQLKGTSFENFERCIKIGLHKTFP